MKLDLIKFIGRLKQTELKDLVESLEADLNDADDIYGVHEYIGDNLDSDSFDYNEFDKALKYLLNNGSSIEKEIVDMANELKCGIRENILDNTLKEFE